MIRTGKPFSKRSVSAALAPAGRSMPSALERCVEERRAAEDTHAYQPMRRGMVSGGPAVSEGIAASALDGGALGAANQGG